MTWICGNWKMNGTQALVQQMMSALMGEEKLPDNLVLFPPSLYVPSMQQIAEDSLISVGVQHLSDKSAGAFTGELSVTMLSDLSICHALIGHSERRLYYQETDELVSKKVTLCLEHGIRPVVCVGELELMPISEAIDEVLKQITLIFTDFNISLSHRCAIAYEPVWAIGSGQVASSTHIAQMHEAIDNFFQKQSLNVPILYGGSVSLKSVESILELDSVSGVLIGGASLKVDEFLGIVRLASE